MGSDRFDHVVLAVDEGNSCYRYESPVAFVINSGNASDYGQAACFLNKSLASVVSLQHEFGIFGGHWGRYILNLTSKLEKPLVTTFHTLHRKPDRTVKEILKHLVKVSTCVVVLSKKSAQLITNVYDAPESKVHVIPHGAPISPKYDQLIEKDRLGLTGRTIVSTMGLLSPNKGVEYGIRAVKDLTKKYPEISYLIVGETHPTVRKMEGEKYRGKLQRLISDLDLAKHVRFVDRFLAEEELDRFLTVTDVYLAPYREQGQVSSGTLTRAMAFGKGIVATPTIFSSEALPERGLFCKFNDHKSIAEQVSVILSDSSLRRELETRAGDYGRSISWRETSEKYAGVFLEAAQTETQGILESPDAQIPADVRTPLTIRSTIQRYIRRKASGPVPSRSNTSSSAVYDSSIISRLPPKQRSSVE